MNPSEAEKIDMLFDALTADAEQMGVELLKLRSHLMSLHAKVDCALTDDPAASVVEKP